MLAVVVVVVVPEGRIAAGTLAYLRTPKPSVVGGREVGRDGCR